MKYNFASSTRMNTFQLVTVTNLFPFEAIQRCQHCQLCELQENLNGIIFSGFYVLMKANEKQIFPCFLSLLNVNVKFDSLSPHQKQHPFCSNMWSMVNANFPLVHFPCHNDTAS